MKKPELAELMAKHGIVASDSEGLEKFMAVCCEEMEAETHRFHVGDVVEVSESYDFGEWRGLKLEVIGVYRSRKTDGIEYCVREFGCRDDGGTDGFDEEDLQPYKG